MEALLDESGSTWHMSMDGSLYGTAMRLEALVALGRTGEAEAAASTLIEPGTYVEPFALRTLGITRGEPALVAQAVDRFEAIGLDWQARRTREQVGV